MESKGFIDHLLVLRLVEAVGQAALPTVVSVEVAGHKNTGAALVCWALPAQTVDLPVLVHLNRKHSEDYSLGHEDTVHDGKSSPTAFHTRTPCMMGSGVLPCST